jgi:hypothetical protein
MGHPVFVAVGRVVVLVGGTLTTSIVGAIAGIPLVLTAWPFLKNPVVSATGT